MLKLTKLLTVSLLAVSFVAGAGKLEAGGFNWGSFGVGVGVGVAGSSLYNGYYSGYGPGYYDYYYPNYDYYTYPGYNYYPASYYYTPNYTYSSCWSSPLAISLSGSSASTRSKQMRFSVLC